ncbi:MAG: DEAD/DEAH box helicase [Bacteriovoracaceae bacterium]
MKKMSFKNLDLHPSVLKALDELGYESPTEIQAKGIPTLIQTNKDFLGQAQTGTGKTAAFAIPLLHKINPTKKKLQGIILTPTRELAKQVEDEIQKIGKYIGVRTTCVYGGASYEKQITALKNGRPQIVVGTPGRVIDLIDRGSLKLDQAEFGVLDEADEMLNMGFLDDVKYIISHLNDSRQLIMFSATMPKQIQDLVKVEFRDYEHVKTKTVKASNENIEQNYVVVREKYYAEALARIIESEDDLYGIVFCRTKLETKQVADELKKRGQRIEVLNGDMGQGEREYSMRKFKERKVEILVCTDVAARGIDVNNLTHVFNYGLPQGNEAYVHRIGRTGRAGMKGKAYTIVSPRGVTIIKKIEKFTKNPIHFKKLPSVEKLKLAYIQKEIHAATTIKNAIQEKGKNFRTDETFDSFKENFEDLERDELLKLFYTWKFNKKFRQYDSLSDIEASVKATSKPGNEKRSRSRRGDRGSRGGRRRSNDFNKEFSGRRPRSGQKKTKKRSFKRS